MVASEVITPVTEPTKWVSSTLLVVKNKTLRVCFDHRDLNTAIFKALPYTYIVGR